MTWVEPTFDCGECGGKIARWPMKNLLKQDILDWRHRTVPEGVAPHRAVLGTPVPLAEIDLAPATAAEEEATGPEEAPPPVVPARLALWDDLPPSAQRLDKKAAQNGWEVQAWYMHGPLMTASWKFSRMVESVVLHLDRDGHRLVAAWQTRARTPAAPEPEWKFDLAYSLGRGAVPLSSPELNAAVAQPRAICESCGEPPALHHSTKTGPVCHAEFVNPEEAP